jgi:hypothetical protein
MSSEVRIRCPKCGLVFALPATLAGARICCPACQLGLVVPDPPDLDVPQGVTVKDWRSEPPPMPPRLPDAEPTGTMLGGETSGHPGWNPRRWIGLGLSLAAVGLLAFFSFAYDTTVETGGGRVPDLGRLNDRIVGTMVGIAAGAIGTFLLAARRK